MSYNRSRFLLGLLQIAVIVGLAVFALGLNPMGYFIPGVMFPKYEITFWPHVKALSMILAFLAAVCLPFDFLLGWALPKFYRRPCPGFFLFLARLAWGIFSHGVLMLIFAVLLLTAGQRFGGNNPLILWLGLLPMIAILATSRSLTGNLLRFWVTPFEGWPNRRGPGASIEPRRRYLEIAAALWVFVGLVLACLHPQASFGSSAGLLTIGLVQTLWSGLGVLAMFRFPEAARMASLLSMVCLGFLSRAHPSVIGRPERWVPGESETSD